MLNLGNYLITELIRAELYRNIDTDTDVLYFDGIAKKDISDTEQKRILCRVPKFTTKHHSNMYGIYNSLRDDGTPYKYNYDLSVKKEYEDAVGEKYNEEIMYTLEQLSSASIKIIREQEDPNIEHVDVKYIVFHED